VTITIGMPEVRQASGQSSMILRATLALLASCILLPAAINAQTGAWPIAILEPPGANVARPILTDVALSADTAVLAYAGTPTHGYRVHFTTHGPGGWPPSQLLAEGTATDGQTIAVDADEQRMAVGLPGAAGGGRIDIFRRDGAAWTFEQSITPPAGVTSFGRGLSIRGDLLAVSAVSTGGGGGLESYRRDVASGQWAAAGFSVSGPVLGAEYFIHTDGERLAACIESVCRTFLDDGNGTWTMEASVAGGRTPVAVSGEWLFVRVAGDGLRIHQRVNADWQLRQTLAGVGPFTIGDSTLIVRNALGGRIAQFSMDGLGTWTEISHLDVPTEVIPSAPIAWNGTLALIGNQSLSPATSAWVATGVVGLPDLSNARFGASLGVTRSRLWIGSPGWSVTDRAAGGVLVHALPGALLPSGGPVAPASPALSRGFGAAMSVDTVGNLVIASRTQTMVEPQEARVSRYSGSTPAPLPPANEFIMPLAQGRILELDIAYDFDAFALTWKRTLAGQRPLAEVLVYSNRGNGFISTQTIVLPDEGDWPDLAYGRRVVVDDDRMVAGVMGYRRDNVFWDYEPASRLPLTLADVPIASGLGANANWIVVPMTDDFAISVGTAYGWTATGGWSTSRRVMKNGFAINGGCKVMAINADDVITCLVTGTGGRPEIYRATRPNATSDWRITAGGPVPGPVEGYGSRFMLAMHGNEVYVGWPQTGAGLAGVDVGRVVGMTFDETILRNGFE